MRTLSTQELDDIFAGDGRVSATIPSVTVTSQSYSNPNTAFPYGGSSWAGPTLNEGGGYCYQGAGTYFAINWQAVPDLADVRCEMNKAAEPGKDMPATASLWFVNDYAFKDRATGNIVHKPSSDVPPNHDVVYGQADAAHNGIYLYAAGVQNINMTNPYKNPGSNVVQPPLETIMTEFQHALFVLAHEAAHGRGVTNEEEAEGYAVAALQRYRANMNQCP